jgi:hypothetical protein
MRIQEELKRELAKEPQNIIRVLRKDNCCLEGYLSEWRSGNNARVVIPPTSFYGELTLEFPNRYSITIDMLDIQTISNVSNNKKK